MFCGLCLFMLVFISMLDNKTEEQKNQNRWLSQLFFAMAAMSFVTGILLGDWVIVFLVVYGILFFVSFFPYRIAVAARMARQ